jgi:4-hydroxyphenylpyruvate dioxygenase
LIEPRPGLLDVEQEETLHRVGLGVGNVLQAVSLLRERGVRFVETGGVHSDPRGALTESQLGGVMFELVHDER